LKSKTNHETIYNYDRKIFLIHKNAQRNISKENFELFESYDKTMVREALSKALRVKHLQTIITLSKMLNKNWIDTGRDDIDGLVYKIMDIYSDEKGQESHSSYDMKKILRIFFRWFKTGNRLREEGKLDPYEIQGIKLKTVKDRLVREDLITPEDREAILDACGENLRDRAIIDVHDDAGTRPGETLSVRIKDVKIDEYGYKKTTRILKNKGIKNYVFLEITPYYIIFKNKVTSCFSTFMAGKKTQKKPIVKKAEKKKTVKTKPKSTKAKTTKTVKSKKNKVEFSDDMGIVIVDDDITIDQEKVNEERRAYLEEARSQEAFD